MRKLFSLFFALAMILSFLPVYAAADGDAPEMSGEEARLRAAVAEAAAAVAAADDGYVEDSTEYELYDALILSDDLTLPENFTLSVLGAVTVPDGVTLTVNGHIEVYGDIVVSSGGRLLIDTELHEWGFSLANVYVWEGGKLTVEAGGELESHGELYIDTGTAIRMDGSYTQGTDTYDDIEYCMLTLCVPCDSAEIDLPGLPTELATLLCEVYSEEALLSALSLAESVSNKMQILTGYRQITLHSDVTVGKNVRLELRQMADVALAQGVVLTNYGEIWANAWDARLTAAPGSEIWNFGEIWFYSENNVLEIQEGAELWDNGLPGNLSVASMCKFICNGTQSSLDIQPGMSAEKEFPAYINARTGKEVAVAFAAGIRKVNVESDLVSEHSIVVPEGAKLFVLPGASLTIRPEDSLTNNGTIIVDGTLNAAGSYYGESAYVSRQGTVTPDTVPQRTELVMEAPSLVGPDSLDTNAWGVYDVYTFAENDEQIPSSAEWSIVKTTVADAEIDPETGDLYAGTSPGEIVIRASTEYGSCDKTILVVQGENTPGLFIEGPHSLDTNAWGVYDVCTYAENGELFYVSDVEWELIFVTDAPLDFAFYHDTGEMYAGTSPGEIILQATTEYGTCEKTVRIVQRKGPLAKDEPTVPNEEAPPMEGGLVIPIWIAVLMLAVLLAAIVFAIARIVIAVRRKKKRKS